MALTGLIFTAYVLAHMYGNLKVFGGQESFDTYAEHLREFGEPILPHEGFLWLLRVVAEGVDEVGVPVVTLRRDPAPGPGCVL